MKSAGIKKVSFLVFVAVLWIACSPDPNKQKLKYLNSGEKYFKAGKYQEATIEFRNAVQIDPRFALAHHQLARAYLSLRNPQAAYRELMEAVTLDPKNSDAQLQLAALLLAGRQYDQAEAVAEKVLAADPKNALAHAVLGEKYALTRDIPKAMLEFQKAIELDPKRIENHTSLGAIYLGAGQASAAETVFKRATELNPKSVEARVAAGQFYFSQGKIAQAEAEMRSGLELDPHAVLPRLLLLGIYRATGKLVDAEKTCVDLKTVAPNDPRAYQALGLFYVSTGQKEKAAAEFRSLLASKPKDRSVKAYLIETLIGLNRIKEATTLNQQILKANPADPLALVSNGRLLIADGKYQEAQGELEKAIKSEPNSAAGYYFLGVVQRALGLSSLAKFSFAHALELSPQMPEAAVAMASLKVQTGDYDEALRLTSRAIQANPNLPSAYLAGAQALLAKGDVAQGEALLQETLKHEPASLPALANLLNLYVRQGRTQEVVQRISTLSQQYPQNAGLHLLLAVGYFSLKELEKSEASVRQAIRLDPRTSNAYTLLGEIDLAKGSVERAKTDFRAAIEADPRNVANYMALAKLYEKEGGWEEAKKLFENAHEVDPASPIVANDLAYFYLEHGGDINVALSLAQMARQKMPDSPGVADTLGWAFYKLGSPESAVVQLKEGAEKAPNNPVIQYHLGMAYIAAGHPDSAQRSLQRALRVSANFDYAASARTALDKISKGSH